MQGRMTRKDTSSSKEGKDVTSNRKETSIRQRQARIQDYFNRRSGIEEIKEGQQSSLRETSQGVRSQLKVEKEESSNCLDPPGEGGGMVGKKSPRKRISKILERWPPALAKEGESIMSSNPVNESKVGKGRTAQGRKEGD